MRTSMLLLLALCQSAWAGEFDDWCADRTAIERVYYNHRTGTNLCVRAAGGAFFRMEATKPLTP